MEEQLNRLAEEKLNELGGPKNKKSNGVNEPTEDGGEFYTKDMNGWDWVGAVADLGANIWENSALPKGYWNKDAGNGYDESPIHVPPTLSGVADGVIEEVTELPQLAKLGYDVATKKEVRQGIWNSVKKINFTSIKNAAEGAVKNKWEKYANSPGHITYHELGKDGVQVASMLYGGFATKGKKLMEAVEESGETIGKKGGKNIPDDDNFDNGGGGGKPDGDGGKPDSDGGKPDGNGKVLDDIILEIKSEFPSTWKFNKVDDDLYEIVDGGGTKWGTVTKDKITAPGRTATGTPGNPVINKKVLVKNMKYDVDGIIYQTDDLGRVVKTNADLDDIVRVRLGNQQIRSVDIKDGVRGVDQGGHIVGSRFFGPGEQINLYPQSANLNQGAWKQMENTWADAMVQGKDVKVEVRAIFEGESKRPIGFDVDYWIDGKKYNQPFEN